MITVLLHGILQPHGALLATCYNKLKHGPQLIVTNTRQVLNDRGIGREQVHPDVDLGYPTVRLLFAGSRLQETDVEVSEHRPASVLLSDSTRNAERMFLSLMVRNAVTVRWLGTWLYNVSALGDRKEFHFEDRAIAEIVRCFTADIDGKPG